METQKSQESNPVAAANDQKPKEVNRDHSPVSSPSHDFSFTITLHPTPNSATPNSTIKCNNKSTSPSFALDLAPADDIFFHGHLLPLHLLSHPPISRHPSSDVSMIEDLNLPPVFQQVSTDLNPKPNNNIGDTKKRSKPKSLSSLFGLGKWWTGSDEADKKKKKKKCFFWKKYASMVEPFFFSKGEKEKRDICRRPHSFLDNSNPKERDGWMRRRRGEFSLPASMRTSPADSGLLLATPRTVLSSSSGERSMEELQNAIQAAIAHCKNSSAIKEDRCKC